VVICRRNSLPIDCSHRASVSHPSGRSSLGRNSHPIHCSHRASVSHPSGRSSLGRNSRPIHCSHQECVSHVAVRSTFQRNSLSIHCSHQACVSHPSVRSTFRETHRLSIAAIGRVSAIHTAVIFRVKLTPYPLQPSGECQPSIRVVICRRNSQSIHCSHQECVSHPAVQSTFRETHCL